MKNEIRKCCICGNQFIGFGNNPDGAVWKDKNGEIVMAEFKENDRCCDECDNMFVIPGRMYRFQLARKGGK